MRLRVLTNTLAGGGAEKQLLLLVKGLVRRGHECRVYCLQPAAGAGRYHALAAEARDAGVEFVYPDRRTALAVLAALAWDAGFGPRSILLCWGFRAELCRLLLPVLWHPCGVLALRSASREVMHRRRWLLRASRLYLNGYLANSWMNVALAEALVPGIGTRARVIPNAIEPAFLEGPAAPLDRSRQVRVHLLGNVRYLIKGYDVLLQVAERARAAGRPVHFFVGGEQPPGEPVLEEEVRKAGLESMVTWCGRVDAPAEFLREADIFMLLSRYEGLPNALLEAMALGLPCIASDVGDLRQFAGEGQSLLIVPPADADAAYAALGALLDDRVEAAALGARARRFCRARFSESQVTAAVDSALKEMAGIKSGA